MAKRFYNNNSPAKVDNSASLLLSNTVLESLRTAQAYVLFILLCNTENYDKYQAFKQNVANRLDDADFLYGNKDDKFARLFSIAKEKTMMQYDEVKLIDALAKAGLAIEYAELDSIIDNVSKSNKPTPAMSLHNQFSGTYEYCYYTLSGLNDKQLDFLSFAMVADIKEITLKLKLNSDLIKIANECLAIEIFDSIPKVLGVYEGLNKSLELVSPEKNTHISNFANVSEKKALVFPLSNLINYLEFMYTGEMTVVGAKPGAGKSIIGMQAVYQFALSGTPAMFISAEMTEEDLVCRLKCSVLKDGTTVNDLLSKRKELTSENVERINELMSLPIFIKYLPDASLSKLEDCYMQAKLKGCKLVVLDYIQLIQHESLENVPSLVNRLSKKYDVHTIALAQLKRSSEQNKHSKPSDEDIAGTYNLYREAHIVFFLHASADDTYDNGLPTKDTRTLILSKLRNGNGDLLGEETILHIEHYLFTNKLLNSYEQDKELPF